MFRYIKFWLKSSNQHGLHSPFVYDYLTKGLYEQKNLSESKQINWILKSINYFKPHKVFVCEVLRNELICAEQNFTQSFKDADLIFIKDVNNFNIATLIDQLDSEQLLFICNNRYNSIFQKKLCDNDKIVLVLDFYIGSLISKRTEQLKQNFFLRL